MLFKLRIISTDAEEAEALRTTLRAIFGPSISLTKARKGGNPKYADSPNLLSYGELELSGAQLDALSNVNQIKLPLKPARKRPQTQGRNTKR